MPIEVQTLSDSQLENGSRHFIATARELGYKMTDEEAFLREQQEGVFAWAQGDDIETGRLGQKAGIGGFH